MNASILALAILIALTSLNVSEACLELWNNHCTSDSDCCSGFCFGIVENDWAEGVCKNSKQGKSKAKSEYGSKSRSIIKRLVDQKASIRTKRGCICRCADNLNGQFQSYCCGPNQIAYCGDANSKST